MKKLKDFVVSIGILIFVFACPLVLATLSYGQEAVSHERTQTVTGSVQEVDWVGRKIVISANFGNPDLIAFYVPDDAVLTSGLETIDLADINQADQVEIVYVDTLAGLKVKRLKDMNVANSE